MLAGEVEELGRGLAPRDLLDEDPAVGEADDAELADEIRRYRPAHLVEISKSVVEDRTEAVAANLDGDSIVIGPLDRRRLPEGALAFSIEMGLVSSPDEADQGNGASLGEDLALAHPEGLGSEREGALGQFSLAALQLDELATRDPHGAGRLIMRPATLESQDSESVSHGGE